jgi:hypothetical protein
MQPISSHSPMIAPHGKSSDKKIPKRSAKATPNGSGPFFPA